MGTTQITVRLDESMVNRMDEFAKLYGLTRTEVMTRWLETGEHFCEREMQRAETPGIRDVALALAKSGIAESVLHALGAEMDRQKFEMLEFRKRQAKAAKRRGEK